MPSQHRKKHQQGARHPRPPKSHHGGFPDRNTQPGYRGGQTRVFDSTEESNSDSFRSVIDDLTIKNQKLKKRLRKLEGLHAQHVTHSERLFELRVHDLPEDKKAELERILQSFTSSIENGRTARDAATQGNEFASGNRSSALDSGYASVSRSGNDSSAPSSGQGRDMRRDDSGKMWPSSSNTSEAAKMKLVVRRLEQLFTGGVQGASADRRITQQQQDVSDLAKAEDNEAKLLAGGQIDVEGTREASLMSPPSNPSIPSIDSDSKESLLTIDEPEQRPTRPIDLDPSREQVAEDNIEYLTHMTESSSKGPGMGTGWMYLNLIINLAQLHTINVTPPFVKKAISVVSSKLELSPDGKMVRWRGDDSPGYDSTMTSSMGDDGSSEQSPTKAGGGSGPSGNEMNPVQSDGSDQRFHYKPMFARSQSFDDDSSSFATSSDTDPDAPRRSNSGESRGSSGRRDTGPIIFYKGGGFCTDLSSQPLREDEEWSMQVQPQYAYVRATTRPLGAAARQPPAPSTKDDSPLFREDSTIPQEEDVMEIDPDDASLIEFSPKFTATSPTNSPPAPIEFEASGIGGVLPADNFAIN
ncbi:frequency clock protein, partial [Sphaerosporella brunnea]